MKSTKDLTFLTEFDQEDLDYEIDDFASYVIHVRQWTDFFGHELANYWKITAILRYNYPKEDVDSIDDDRFFSLWAEYQWVRDFESAPVVKDK